MVSNPILFVCSTSDVNTSSTSCNLLPITTTSSAWAIIWIHLSNMDPRISTLDLLTAIPSTALNIKGAVASACLKPLLTYTNYLTDYKISSCNAFHSASSAGNGQKTACTSVACCTIISVSDYISSLSLWLVNDEYEKDLEGSEQSWCNLCTIPQSVWRV